MTETMYLTGYIRAISIVMVIIIKRIRIVSFEN